MSDTLKPFIKQAATTTRLGSAKSLSGLAAFAEARRCLTSDVPRRLPLQTPNTRNKSPGTRCPPQIRRPVSADEIRLFGDADLDLERE